MPAMTRRLFAGLLAGATAGATQLSGFVQHKVLKRPYVESKTIPAIDRKLYDCLLLRGEFNSSVRVKVTKDGEAEPIAEMTIFPNSGQQTKLLAVHRLKATSPVKITIQSAKPFKLYEFSIKTMHPAFQRVDGEIRYHDPEFAPHPEYPGFGVAPPHYKALGPASADVAYGFTPAAPAGLFLGRFEDGMTLRRGDRLRVEDGIVRKVEDAQDPK